MKNPALVIGASAAALAVLASSKKKSSSSKKSAKVPKEYTGSAITMTPDGSKVFVGVKWPYEVLIPTLNTLEDTPLDSIDALYGYLKIVDNTDFKTTDGKPVKLAEMPETPQVEDLKKSILEAAKAYVALRSQGITKVMLGHYQKIMAQYKCELPESDEYLPPSCIISIALGSI